MRFKYGKMEKKTSKKKWLKMDNKYTQLKESNIMPIFLSFLKFAMGETIFVTSGADPFVPWPFP